MVLFVTTSIRGGAGIACRRTWEAFCKADKFSVTTLVYREKADLWIRQKHRGEPAKEQLLYKHFSDWPDETLSREIDQDKSSFSATYFSVLDESNAYDDTLIQLFSDHNIINLHWAAGLVSKASLTHLAETKKTTILTLHDQNYFTGGCHYSAGCRLFTDSCDKCPQIKSQSGKKIVADQYLFKKAILGLPNFYWTGPSNWIVNEARNSRIVKTKGNILGSIKNPVVDAEQCHPEEIRKIEGSFSNAKHRIALVADDLSDPRKGILIGCEALARALSETPCNTKERRIEIHLIGSTHGSKEALENILTNYIDTTSSVAWEPFIINHGRVPSHYVGAIMRRVDFLIFPSIEENYSNLVIETLIQGTRVVALAVGGNIEIASMFPSLMHTYGSTKTSHINGLNANDTPSITKAKDELCKGILEHLFMIKAPVKNNRAIAECKSFHSSAKIASDYCRAFMKAIRSNEKHKNIDKHNTELEVLNSFPRRLLSSGTTSSPRRQINPFEPVFWLGKSNDAPICFEKDDLLITLTLKPSWDNDYFTKKLNDQDLAWMEISGITHAQQMMPELEYWDLVILLAKAKEAKSMQGQIKLLACQCDDQNAMPILIQTLYKPLPSSNTCIKSISDAIWCTVYGKPLVTPMTGTRHYDPYLCFPQEINLINLINNPWSNTEKSDCLSVIRSDQININEPVYWLGPKTYNDISVDSSEVLIAACLYPSWRPDYFKEVFVEKVSFEITDEIPHYTAELPELKYWNFALIQISINSECMIFNQDSDENCLLPLLLLALAKKEKLSKIKQFSDLGMIEKDSIIVPAMAGLSNLSLSIQG